MRQFVQIGHAEVEAYLETTYPTALMLRHLPLPEECRKLLDKPMHGSKMETDDGA